MKRISYLVLKTFINHVCGLDAARGPWFGEICSSLTIFQIVILQSSVSDVDYAQEGSTDLRS
jgi:hypothetical protein